MQTAVLLDNHGRAVGEVTGYYPFPSLDDDCSVVWQLQHHWRHLDSVPQESA